MKYITKFALLLLFVCSVSLSSASNADCDKYIAALEDFERYSDTQWTDATTVPDAGYWGSGLSGEREGLKPGFTANDGIRSMNGVALANAVMIMANPDSKLNAKRLDKIEKVLRYSALTHKKSGTDYKCIDGYQWGLGWQTNMWAGSMGFACALLEDKLPAELVAQVKRVVGAEADYRGTVPPGSDYIGNTIAEENAWNTNIVALAAAWMSDDARAKEWLETAKSYLVNSYSVDADKQGPLGKWSSTINLYPSFMLENHGFYHPGYHSVTGSSIGDSYLMAKLTNEDVSKELDPFVEHNVMNVWAKVRNVLKANGEFLFPCGQDWSLHGYGQVAYMSYIANHFKQPEAITMQAQIIDRLLERQAIFGTGEFIGKSNENTFYVEAVTARRIALAWLHNYVNDFKLAEAGDIQNFSNHADDVKIITSRSDKGNISLSYGRRILLAAEGTPGTTPESRYVFCSDNLGVIGRTPYGVATDAEMVKCDLYDDGFRASLDLIAQDGVVACDIYARHGVVAIIQRPKDVAKHAVESRFDSFTVSIENYILNGASRDIYHCGGVEKIGEASGANLSFGNVLNISDCYGIIYGPNANSSYIAPEEYNRRGASIDSISSVLADPFAPSYVILLCNDNWATTQDVAKSVSFTTCGESATLEFISPDGEVVTVVR